MAKDIRVYIFLSEECIISQYYSLPLQELYHTYANDELTFLGIFPNPSSSPEKMAAFVEKYRIPFAVELDENQVWLQKLGASVTPEVVVWDGEVNRALYQGRIDDRFFDIGRRRPRTNHHELRDVLEAISNGREITTENQTAVGCIITPFDPSLKDHKLCAPKG